MGHFVSQQNCHVGHAPERHYRGEAGRWQEECSGSAHVPSDRGPQKVPLPNKLLGKRTNGVVEKSEGIGNSDERLRLKSFLMLRPWTMLSMSQAGGTEGHESMVLGFDQAVL